MLEDDYMRAGSQHPEVYDCFIIILHTAKEPEKDSRLLMTSSMFFQPKGRQAIMRSGIHSCLTLYLDTLKV